MKFDSTSDNFQKWLTSLPPDVLEQVLQGGTLDQRDQMVQNQMAQVQQLREQRAADHPYGAGAGIAGGIAGALGGIQQAVLQRQQQGNIDKRQASIEALVRALREGNAKGANLTPPSMLQAPSDQSFGQMNGVQSGDYASVAPDASGADPARASGGQPASFKFPINKRFNTKPVDETIPLELAPFLQGE